MSAAMLLKLVYWLAVLAVSVMLVIGLILWFESQDESRIEGSSAPPPALLT
jgi:cytochrome b subunit of formate dehydrogenase